MHKKHVTKGSNIPKIGMLVLIKEDNIPSLKWKMGRIIKVHPGEDNVVRVVTLKTPTGAIKRPTSKIAMLSVEQDENE